jgi:hypothetical protein
VEEIMAETAVGLFEETASAERVASLLRTHGFSADAVRSISRPLGTTVTSPTSTPGLDFAAGLARDLRSMGATEEECEAYVSQVQEGGTLLFVTGTLDEANQAASLMNENGATEIEEFAGAMPALPAVHVGEVAATGGISLKEDRSRANTPGARVFTW